MKFVVPSLAAMEGLHDRGFTFVGAKGPGEDLYVSFHELRREAMKRARAFLDLGLQKGDRVALVVPDGHDFIPAFLGAVWAGLVPVPLYPPLSLGKLDAFMEALVSILNVAKPRLLVTNERVGKVLWSAIGKAQTIEKVLVAEELAKAPHADVPPVDAKPGDTCFLQFTSGSTSTPKGVVVTHASLAANVKAIIEDGISADPATDRGVSWLPLYHDMGLIGFVLAPVCYGVAISFIPTMSFIKNATLWLETIHRHRATMTFAPNFAYALVAKRARAEQLARWDLTCLRVCGCGAEPVNPEVMRTFATTFARAGLRSDALMPAYGMAEATLAMSFHGPNLPLEVDRIDAPAYHADQKARPAADGAQALEVVCCGRTFPGHEISAQDSDGRLLPDRVVGELCFRGPSVAAGYFENAEASRAAGMSPPGGWLRTGDLGYLVDGKVFVSGRLKDILIVNGRNYYPQRIEWVVDEIAGIRRGSAVVFTRPGTSSEEIVVAAESRGGETAAVIDAVKARISEEFGLSVADVALLPPGTLPKTSSGKLQRRKTREQYLDGSLGREGVRTTGAANRLLVAKHLAFSFLGRARHEARGLLKRLGV